LDGPPIVPGISTVNQPNLIGRIHESGGGYCGRHDYPWHPRVRIPVHTRIFTRQDIDRVPGRNKDRCAALKLLIDKNIWHRRLRWTPVGSWGKEPRRWTLYANSFFGFHGFTALRRREPEIDRCAVVGGHDEDLCPGRRNDLRFQYRSGDAVD